jgi:FtsP/CotA-like multicopper oxidase with cupredoxin domain
MVTRVAVVVSIFLSSFILSSQSWPTSVEDKKGGDGGNRPQTPIDTPPFMDRLPQLTDADPLRHDPGSLVQAIPAANIPNLKGIVDPDDPNSTTMQRFGEFKPVYFYQINIKEGEHEFHAALTQGGKNKKTKIWGYEGMYPGPTFVSQYGKPIVVRFTNTIAQPGGLFGLNSFATHLHNGHTAAESDGNPNTQVEPTDPTNRKKDRSPSIDFSKKRDYHYAMARAGFATKEFLGDGDPAETLSTLWYHDHQEMNTAQHVYAGLLGFHLFFELDNGKGDRDTGNEKTGLRLPSGPFDVPLVFADKVFDKYGQLALNPLRANGMNNDGFVGDRFTVNGKIQPYFKVNARRYRLRLLNAGPSRFYSFFIVNEKGENQPFLQIGSDESLLEHPVPKPDNHPQAPTTLRQGVVLGVAERADIVIDFSKVNGKTLYLVNRLDMDDSGRGPRNDRLLPIDFQKSTNLIMRFDVGDPVTDNSKDLKPADTLRVPPKLPTLAQLKTFSQRGFEFVRGQGKQFLIDDGNNPLPFDKDNPRVIVDPGTADNPTAEIWKLVNKNDSWSHPVHPHLEEFRVLSVGDEGSLASFLRGNSGNVSLVEQSRKDVTIVGRQESNRREVAILLKFRDFTGRYVMHCHNVFHEDMSMMLGFWVKK